MAERPNDFNITTIISQIYFTKSTPLKPKAHLKRVNPTPSPLLPKSYPHSHRADVYIFSEMQAEEDKANGGNYYRTLIPDSHFLWAGASGAQFTWAVVLYRKGSGPHSTSMPFRAFAVASLIVGAGATAAFAGIRASGIHKVEDLIRLGANIRTGLGVQRRARDE